MQAVFSALDGWLLKTTLGGGVVLLAGALWMLISRQPAKRQRIGELALLFALLVALPAAMPAWWSLPGAVKSSIPPASSGGAVTREAPTPEEPLTDLSLFNEQDSHDTFEILQVLGILDERNEPVPVQAAGNVDLVQQPGGDDEASPAAGAALLSSGDNPWFRWGLRAYGVVYLGFVLFLLGRCGVGYYGLWRYWRTRRPAPAHVHAALAELEPDEARRPRIGVCPQVHGPVSYGLWKPTILLSPAFCNEGDPEKLRWVLAHELTHLRRRDAWGCLLLALGGAVYFHLPWFWWLKRQVRLAQEYVADAAAAKIASAVDYAQYLVSLTSLTSRPSLASGRAAGVFETQSDLYRRVHMLLRQRNVIEGGAPRWWTLSAAASFLALAACTAGVKVQADEPEKRQVTVTVVNDDDDAKPAKKQNVKVVKQDKGTVRVELKLDEKDKDGESKIQVFELKDGKLVPAGKIKAQGFDLFELKEGKQDGTKAVPYRVMVPGEPGLQGKPAQPGQWSFVVGDGQKRSLDEVMKKLDQVMSKLDKDEQPELRAKLEEVKTLLKKMEGNSIKTGVWNVDGKLRLQGADEARKQLEKAQEQLSRERDRVAEAQANARARVQESVERARVAEREARAAAEKALAKWQASKDGKDRDAAVKELEKAIAEKEIQIKRLREGGKLGEGPDHALRLRLRQNEEEHARAADRLAEGRQLLLERARNLAQGNRPRLGVSLAEVEEEARENAKIPEGVGILVNDVVENSAAWNGGKGLKSGDILVEFAGKKVSSDPNAFVKTVGDLKEGTYDAVVYRNGKKTTVRGIKFPTKVEKPAKVKKDAVTLEGDAAEHVILNLKDHLGQLDKIHGDAVIKLDGVRKQIKDGKGEIALELDNAKKALDGMKGELTLRLADVAKLEGLKEARLDDVKKDVSNLVELKLGDMKDGLVTITPKLAQDMEKLPLSLKGLAEKPEMIQKGLIAELADLKAGDTSNLVKSLPLMATGESQQASKPRLGIEFGTIDDETAEKFHVADDRGVMVREVVPGSPAEKAGFQKNDILIEFAGKPVSRDNEKFAKTVAGTRAGSYTATVVRKGKEVKIRNIVLGETAAKDDARAKKDWMVEDDHKDQHPGKEQAKKHAAKAKDKSKDDSFGRGGNFGPVFGGNGNRNTSITVNNGEFTAKSKIDDDRTVIVTGRMENGKATPRKITIKDGDDEKEYKSVKDVPAADRGDVETLLKSISGRGNVIRFGPGFNFGGNFGGNLGNMGPEFEAQMKLMEEQMKRMRDQFGQGNPGFGQIEKQLEEMRKQLRELNKDRDDK